MASRQAGVGLSGLKVAVWPGGMGSAGLFWASGPGGMPLADLSAALFPAGTGPAELPAAVRRRGNLIENPARPPQVVGVSSSANTKAFLREQVRARLKAISPEQRSIASAQIRARLAAEKSFTDAKAILFFAPLPNEPDVWPLLTAALLASKTVALPGFEAATQSYIAVRVADLARDLVAGQFGIREPAAHCPAVPLNQLDFVLVPGVAFALDGHRLGRGKGYYDRLLHSVRGATCGVAFDEQIVGELPVEPHDIRLSYILTPTRWQTASPARF